MPRAPAPKGTPIVLDPAMQRVYTLVQRIADTFGGGVHFIVPVHPNPNVRATVSRMLALPNCSVVPALDYRDLLHVLSRASLVLTDSGGIQEEAPSLGKPVLVMRDATERPEGVEAGTLRLVGTDEEIIYYACRQLLDDPKEYTAMAKAKNPYGDGYSSAKIADIIEQKLGI
jgi:UDP-N-acetylglucosamine 2-epimerase (non-hydrolysing)